MTATYIKEQVKTIEKATKSASQSKETALRFLKDAGIINSPAANTNKVKVKK